jgi:hypothetical protein
MEQRSVENIQCAFLGDENASRIMTTTRIQDVAKSCCRQDGEYKDYFYPMKPLYSTDAKRLFFQRIFKPEDDCPPELEKLLMIFSKNVMACH